MHLKIIGFFTFIYFTPYQYPYLVSDHPICKTDLYPLKNPCPAIIAKLLFLSSELPCFMNYYCLDQSVRMSLSLKRKQHCLFQVQEFQVFKTCFFSFIAVVTNAAKFLYPNVPQRKKTEKVKHLR